MLITHLKQNDLILLAFREWFKRYVAKLQNQISCYIYALREVNMKDEKVPLLTPLYFLWFQIRQFWSGKKSLTFAFWGVGLLGNILNFAFLIYLINNAESWMMILGVVFPFYLVFSLKSIWSCSLNVNNNKFGDITKVLLLIYLGVVAFSIARIK